MRLPRLFLVLLLLFAPAGAQEIQRFRQWIGGTEIGGMEVAVTRSPAGERIEHREWTELVRLGVAVRQEMSQTATRSADGAVVLSWRASLSAEPITGEAAWSPAEPGVLRVHPAGGSAVVLPLPQGATPWPGDGDARLRQAARERRPVQVVEFTGAMQQWARLDLEPVGPEPLPGFPDAVRFKGRLQAGPMATETEVWISPSHGEVKQVAEMAGLVVLLQRAELPAPSQAAGPAFFERTLAQLPPHPFLPWLREATLRWDGPGIQELPQDEQQAKAGGNRYRVKAAAPPDRAEAADMPVTGAPSPEDLPFLAPTPLVQFQAAAFNGLLARLNPPKGATRWELAERVTRFVFEWITDKDMTVGFASAQEVARIPRGDCTEHGVLAVALLRRLGVPARGAVGWAALGEVLGLHFWVEVRVGGRWIPVDPTFDQAPASALRLKLATTDLADLGSIGWDTASLRFVDGAWVPEAPWLDSVRLTGDAVTAPDGSTLRLPGGHWTLKEGRLAVDLPSTHGVLAVIRPDAAQLAGARLLAGPALLRKGWWSPRSRTLWIGLGGNRWLQVDRMDEPSAFQFLDLLEFQP